MLETSQQLATGSIRIANTTGHLCDEKRAPHEFSLEYRNPTAAVQLTWDLLELRHSWQYGLTRKVCVVLDLSRLADANEISSYSQEQNSPPPEDEQYFTPRINTNTCKMVFTKILKNIRLRFQNELVLYCVPQTIHDC